MGGNHTSGEKYCQELSKNANSCISFVKQYFLYPSQNGWHMVCVSLLSLSALHYKKRGMVDAFGHPSA
jgi:hypothetical protein